jgi:hypothetical protein
LDYYKIKDYFNFEFASHFFNFIDLYNYYFIIKVIVVDLSYYWDINYLYIKINLKSINFMDYYLLFKYFFILRGVFTHQKDVLKLILIFRF